MTFENFLPAMEQSGALYVTAQCGLRDDLKLMKIPNGGSHLIVWN